MSRKRIAALAALTLLAIASSPSPAPSAVEAQTSYVYQPYPESLFTQIPLGTIKPEKVSPVQKTKPRAKNVVIEGTASYYESWCNCTAMTDQRWRGQRVVIVGPIGTKHVRITDAGPVPSLHRVADLPPFIFTAICGPLSRGLCHVQIFLESAYLDSK